jgi:ligand-binding sensor domain-containing protein
MAHLWIGTVDAGVWQYDGNAFINYTTKNGLSSNAINFIYKDKNDEMWFGTDANGICKFNGHTFYPFTFQK